MPKLNAIFRRKSNITSKNSKICQEEYKNLTLALKSIVRRLIICYKSLCCFPLDQIVPKNPRSVKHGPNMNRKSGLCQTSDKGLREIKIINIPPRSRVSFNDPVRAKSEIRPGKSIDSKISSAKNVKSEVSILKKVKSEVFTEIKLKNEKAKQPKKSKTRFLKEKSKKILDFGSGSIKKKFKHRKKSSGSCRSTDTSIKSKKQSKHVMIENRWKRTKRMMKMSNATNLNGLKWIRHDTKRRESLTATSTDNEESAGDGPVTPKLSNNVTKIPLQWNLVKEQIFSDTDIDFDPQVSVRII